MAYRHAVADHQGWSADPMIRRIDLPLTLDRGFGAGKATSTSIGAVPADPVPTWHPCRKVVAW